MVQGLRVCDRFFVGTAGMNIAAARLDLAYFDSLPRHTRRCVFWEVDSGPVDDDQLSPTSVHGDFESEFDKEAWISGVLLDWGTCGQVAVDGRHGHIVGTAFYAPPARVPRSGAFPTSPVSADAVLLTSIRVEPGFDEAAPILIDATVTDLVRRGVRAVEAFGVVRRPVESDMEAVPDDVDEAIAEMSQAMIGAPHGGVCTRCMMGADFLKDSGFDVIASHPRFPRFRLELDEGLGWKHEVEDALDKLVVMAAMELAGRERKTQMPVGRSNF